MINSYYLFLQSGNLFVYTPGRTYEYQNKEIKIILEARAMLAIVWFWVERFVQSVHVDKLNGLGRRQKLAEVHAGQVKVAAVGWRHKAAGLNF